MVSEMVSEMVNEVINEMVNAVTGAVLGLALWGGVGWFRYQNIEYRGTFSVVWLSYRQLDGLSQMVYLDLPHTLQAAFFELFQTPRANC